MYFNNNPQDERIEFNGTISSVNQKPAAMLDGVYPYTVTSYVTGNFPGSANLPECGKITITMLVSTEEGKTKVWTDLLLCRAMEWKLSAFFQSIGQKKNNDEPFQMDWSRVLGARGVACFKPKSYVSRDGEEKTCNNVKYFVDYDEKYFPDEEPVTLIEMSDDTALPF